MGNQTFCGILMQNNENQTIIKSPKTHMELHYDQSNILWLTHRTYANLIEIKTFNTSDCNDEPKISLEIKNPSFYLDEEGRKGLASILNSIEVSERREID